MRVQRVRVKLFTVARPCFTFRINIFNLLSSYVHDIVYIYYDNRGYYLFTGPPPLTDEFLVLHDGIFNFNNNVVVGGWRYSLHAAVIF